VRVIGDIPELIRSRESTSDREDRKMKYLMVCEGGGAKL